MQHFDRCAAGYCGIPCKTASQMEYDRVFWIQASMAFEKIELEAIVATALKDAEKDDHHG